MDARTSPYGPFITQHHARQVTFSGDRNEIPTLLREAADWLTKQQPHISVYKLTLHQSDEYESATVTLEVSA
jgi:hypothetical protein